MFYIGSKDQLAFFCCLHGSYFVVELKIVIALTVNSKLFLSGFLSLIALLQDTGVVLLLFQYSQLPVVLLLHSIPWSPCFLVFCSRVPAFKFFSLAAWALLSKAFVIVFKIYNYFCHWSSHCELFPRYFYLWSLHCELLCHCNAIQHYFWYWSLCFGLLVCRVIF